MTDQAKRRRGRPRIEESPGLAAAYDVIQRTGMQLLLWGYPLRRKVASTLARVAPEILKTDRGPVELSEARIEQIIERPVELYGRVQRPAWGRYSQSYLETLRPQGLTLDELARKLLVSGGEWPDDGGPSSNMTDGDAVLTPKAHEAYLCERLAITQATCSDSATGAGDSPGPDQPSNVVIK